jgi:hypothetical protein
MIAASTLREIVALYTKHGWLLRRVLLSERLRKALGDSLEAIFGNAAVYDSDVDAAWFSRPQGESGVPWEIRHLSDFPFALLENIDENDDKFEGALNTAEARLRKSILAKDAA